MELIDKAELMKYPIRIDHYDKEHGNKHFVLGTESVLEFAEQLPIIDAVKVVRCCDCKYSVAPYKDSDDNVPYLYCYHPNLDEDALSPKVDFTDFCSYGRRESEGT